MKKHNIVRVVLAALIVLLVCPVCFFPAHAEREAETEAVTESIESETESGATGIGDIQKTEWEIFFEEKILPNIVAALTVIATLYIVLSPLIIRIKNTNDKIQRSTESVDRAAKSAKDSQEKYESACTKSIENDKKIAAFDERLRLMERKQDQTIRMLKSGFCNLDEIVKKGYAEEIAREGEENEKEGAEHEDQDETAD